MEISYANSKIRKICTDEKTAQKVLGKDCARVLNKRLRQMQEAETLAELRLLPGAWHELTGERKKQIACSLLGLARLVCVPEDPIPLKPDGGIDWSRVTSIVNLEIIDYH